MAPETMMNVEMDPNDQKVLKFHKIERTVLNLCVVRMMCPFFHGEFIDNLIFGRKIKKYQDEIAHFLKKITDEKLEKIKNSVKEISKNDEDINYENEDILNLYMKVAYTISQIEGNENIVYTEMLTIIEAGTSVVAIMLGFCLLMLSIYPDIQDKVYEELYDIFGESTRDATDEDLKQLTYTTQVLQETLRRFVGPYIYRKVEKDTKIGDRIFPAGSNIIISACGIHLNPKYYTDPMKFNPDNFAPDAVKSRHKCAYIAFSAGQRGCIGMPFAMMEMKIILSSLLRNYIFETSFKKLEDVELECGFLITSKFGFPVTIKPRIKA